MEYLKAFRLLIVLLLIVILMTSAFKKGFCQSTLKVSRDRADASLVIQDSTVRSTKAFFPAGQSNADGRVLESEWPLKLRDSLENFKGYFHETQRFYSAKAGFNVSDQGYWLRGDSLKNGLEIPLHKYLKFFGKWKFAKITRGGAPVTLFNFDNNTIFTREGFGIQMDAFHALSAEIDSTKSFWFWLQGETEAAESTLDTNYGSDLQNVIGDVGVHIYQDLYGIMLLTNDALDAITYPNTAGIRQQQLSVAQNNYMGIYDPSGLDLKDSVHYSAEAYEKIAKEIAIIYYKRFYNITLR